MIYIYVIYTVIQFFIVGFHFTIIFHVQSTVNQLGTTLPFGFEVIENEYKKSQLLALLLVIGSIDLALDVPATEHRLLQALRDLVKEDLI